MSLTGASDAGAGWLVEDGDPTGVLTPDGLTDEQRMIRRTAEEFVANEIEPALDGLERKDWTRARALLRRCGDLGLLGVDVPEPYGGAGLDKATAVVVSEAFGPAASFGAAFGAQTNLAIVPILWFGTDAQKQQYLPRLIAGDIVGAYALSEAGSGSDALGARTRAERQPDGSWRLSGEKLWITNGGFADVFIVFAKVDGEHFSAFIVDRSAPGVSSGAEEHKMGLHGSSTTPLLLQDASVPAANLLGDIGKGHKIAFNVLNYGRFKLAAMCSGCARTAIGEAARYAAARHQFGQPIAAFGAIRHKLAEMTVRHYVVESMLYRTAGLIDGAQATGTSSTADILQALAVEASLLKVAGSEMLDFVLDENIQIHGGNGFVRDYPAERRYRDARVNRIFEGTNEINRLLVPTLLAKRALAGSLALAAARDEGAPEATAIAANDLQGATRRNVSALKQTARLALGLAIRTYGDKLAREQEVVMLVSDVVREAFGAESAMLRAARAGWPERHRDVAAVAAYDAFVRAGSHARTALAAMVADGAPDTTMASAAAVNTIAIRRRIADRILIARQ